MPGGGETANGALAEPQARPGAAWGLSTPPVSARPAPSAPERIEPGSAEWASGTFASVDRQGFPTPLGEAGPADAGTGFPSLAERGFPPVSRSVTETHWPGTEVAPDAAPDHGTRSHRRPAADPGRSIPVTGAAPGGPIARPGAVDNETGLDDSTNPDLVPGATRSGRSEAAAAVADAPAKQGRRDQKPPKQKRKRRVRGQAGDAPGTDEAAMPGSSADAPAAAAAAVAAAAVASPGAVPSQLPPAPPSDPQRTSAQPPAAKAPAAEPPAAEPSADQPAARPAATESVAGAKVAREPGRSRAGRRTSRRRSRRVYAAVGGVVVIAGAAVAFEMLQGGGPAGPAHQIVAPQRIGSYAQAPALAASMKAAQVRRSIVTQSNGEASNVVAAVYESSASQPSSHSSTGPGGSSSSPAVPAGLGTSQIVLFIGGNLTGTSPSSFITSFIGKLPGAVTTAAGPLGGEAACVPSAGGNPAECAWADNDTFGLVTSPTLDARALASELRQMRLQVELRVHPR